MDELERNDLQITISQALREMKAEAGDKFDIQKVNLAELERRTGLTRKKLRNLKENGFIVKPHGLAGVTKEHTVLSGFTCIIETLLKAGVTNSSVIKDRLDEAGYSGGLTQVKEYVASHRNLVPAKRQVVAPQGSRGQRYTSEPGESFQMDWGFVDVETDSAAKYRAACFAMICHHCGERFVEFFPNAKQENLFIGILHGFQRMGVPSHVLTDNMKSVVTGRDSEGHPVWNTEYADFMAAVGFETRLCKPRHPFTKGAVERLVKFVKDNFMAARTFGSITDLNYEALRWCDRQNSRYHDGVFCIPHEEHENRCRNTATTLEMTDNIGIYLWPERRISFDGFINYEGRRFGVPYSYTGKTCRVCRKEFTLYIYTPDLKRKLTEHNVTWSRRDSFCEDQYAKVQPEEFPTAPVAAVMHQNDPPESRESFSNFNFDKEVEW
ncbi:MAG: IS21 family transposase [Lachnospiraceae bacterium]|nr:IS21 family transposase [Lachnospiraceae bacterium]